MKIKSQHVFYHDSFLPRTIDILHGKISDVTEFGDADYDFQDAYILPGFIEVHTHGCYGVNTVDDPRISLKKMSEKLPLEGVTTFLPTTTTLPEVDLLTSLNEMGQYILNQYVNDNEEGFAQAYGIHLEGPFLNKQYAGAQHSQYILDASIESYKRFQKASLYTIKYLTVAPEIPHADSLIKHIVRDNANTVISLGHTGATNSQAKHAIDLGATSITHLWNGMSPLHHREPNIILTSLMDDRVYVQVTADGIHLDFDIISFIIRNKGADKVILITDSNQLKGMPPGDYNLNGREITVDEHGISRLKKNGSIAGSTAKLIDCFKNVIHKCDVSLADAVKMTSINPAKMLQIDDSKGYIKPGYDADFVVLDHNYEVIATICKGKVAYMK